MCILPPIVSADQFLTWQTLEIIVLGLLAFLMVSTWRYRSFKDFHLLRPFSPLTVILWGALIYLTWNYSQPVFLAMAIAYVGSGIVVRIGGSLRRRFRRKPVFPPPPPPKPGTDETFPHY